MRGQTTFEFLLLASGVVIIALVAGYSILSSAQTISTAIESVVPGKGKIGIEIFPTTERGVAVTALCSASLPRGVDTITLYLDGTVASACKVGRSEGNCALTVIYGSTGPHSVTCEANTPTGVVRRAVRNFTVSEPSFPSPPSSGPPSVRAEVLPPPERGEGVTLRCLASDDGSVSMISVYLDGSIQKTCTLGEPFGTCTIYDVFADAASHTLRCVAKDNKYASSSDQTTFSAPSPTLADYPPIVTRFSVTPSSGGPSTTFYILCEAKDDKGIKTLRTYVDGNLLKVCSLSPCTSATTLSPGTHTIQCVAEDTYGQKGYSPTSTVTVTVSAVDTTPPSVSISSPPNGYTTSSTSVAVSFAASDDTALSQILVDCDSEGTPEKTFFSISNPYSGSYTCTYPSSGTYTITVTAIDTSGNESSASVGITVSAPSSPAPAPSPVPPPAPSPVLPIP